MSSVLLSEVANSAEFATSDKRTELINEVKKLETQKLEPRTLANKINSLQKQWQNLDQHGKTASKDKWSTFKEASLKVDHLSLLAVLPCWSKFCHCFCSELILLASVLGSSF